MLRIGGMYRVLDWRGLQGLIQQHLIKANGLTNMVSHIGHQHTHWHVYLMRLA